MQKYDVEKLEMEYSKELAERREVAINYQGQVVGRHPDLFGHSEMQHMIRGYLEGFEKAKSIMYTEEQLIQAISMAKGEDGNENYDVFQYTTHEILQLIMPTKKYTITVLNGLLKGNKYIKYSIPEVNGILEYLDQMGYSASVKKESLKSKKN